MRILKNIVWGMAVVLTAACGTIPIRPPQPNPEPPPACGTAGAAACPDQPRTIATIVLDNATNQPVEGAACVIDNNAPPSPISGSTSNTGYVTFNGVWSSVRQTGIRCTHNEYYDLNLPVTIPVEGNYQFPPIYMNQVPPPLPPHPTRDAALAFNMTAQGLMVHTQQFGDLHWWDAALAWLQKPDRLAVYAAKKAMGDTHVIIELPDGKPLYDECCNDYSPDRFPALDWTNGGQGFDHRLADLVVEVRQNGLLPALFADEATHDVSLKLSLQAVDALQKSDYGDLTGQVAFFSPGWDGVFYGWEPSGTLIPDWAAQMRVKCTACRLGMEFNEGHIPIGEGGADYQPGGRMKDYDIILAEFGPSLHQDSFWQIVGRMVRPYNRPSDQPAGDDPNPPYYLGQPNPRGLFKFGCFEWRMYDWVRGRVTSQEIQSQRDYARAAGCYIIG